MKVSPDSCRGKWAAEWHGITPACLLWSQSPGYCCLRSGQRGWHSWCSWTPAPILCLQHGSLSDADFTVSPLNSARASAYYNSPAFGTWKYSTRHRGHKALCSSVCSHTARMAQLTCFILVVQHLQYLKHAPLPSILLHMIQEIKEVTSMMAFLRSFSVSLVTEQIIEQQVHAASSGFQALEAKWTQWMVQSALTVTCSTLFEPLGSSVPLKYRYRRPLLSEIGCRHETLTDEMLRFNG